VKPFRTILHGTCLLGGRHPKGSKLAKECPVLRRQERQKQRDQGVDTGTPVGAPSEPLNPEGLASGFRDTADAPERRLAHRRLKAGRPAATEPSRHARYRRRHPEYQQREADRKARRLQES
jgi:hypothetical protein